jgi:two-component system cell cycle sensor histidine kinase PleC
MDISAYTLPIMVMLLIALAVVTVLLINSAINRRKLASRLEEATATCRRRDDFFSDMVHELRTPLSVILGAIQLIEKDNGEQFRNERTAKNLNTVKQNCYRLLRLTNNLLDLAKSESGYLALNLENCELNGFIDEIVQTVRPFAEKKQLELRCIKAEKPVNTALDVEKTERIMLNLLSNAIKFSDPGGTVTVSICESDGRAYISVKDTGAGIPADKQKEIFVRYKQSGHCREAEKSGSGIGLSLVKTFVELHNGSIKLVSEPGKGSEFIIGLPLITADEGNAGKNYRDIVHRSEAAQVEFSGTFSITT